MSKVLIYHGSDHIVQKPDIKKGKSYNDYGRGFYCTVDPELAKEWACKKNTDGYVNTYTIDLSGLNILNLNSNGYTILNWIAVLLKNRIFTLNTDIQNTAREYIISNFYTDTSKYDIVEGYRADDSYFSYAEAFVSNTIPLRILNKALRLGNLGEQIFLVSKAAFDAVRFVGSESVDKEIYYQKFDSRDKKAREDYRKAKDTQDIINDIYILDIIRQEMKNDDPRIQRIVSE